MTGLAERITSEAERAKQLDESYRRALEALHEYLRREDLGFFERRVGLKDLTIKANEARDRLVDCRINLNGMRARAYMNGDK